MYVKLAFSVASHLDSEIMIMDEVLAVGDMAFQKKCLDKMSNVSRSQGRTILYVSHNMNTIRQLCDRVMVLHHGKVAFDGDVDEGIGAYIGINDNTSCFVDMSKLPRDPEFSPHPVTMNSIEILDNEKCKFEIGTSLRVLLCCVTTKHFENAFVRFIIKSAEGTPVTMATANNGIELLKENNNQLECIIDISRLVPGKYSLSPVIYEVNELGVNVNLDGLKEVIGFEIVTKPGFNNNMIWQTRYWGYFYGNPVEVINKNGCY